MGDLTVNPTTTIPSDRLYVTPEGIVGFVGTKKEGDDKPPLIVLRTPPWTARHLLGGPYRAKFFVAAGARLRLGTGRHDTEPEFLGYLGKFVLRDQGNILVFSNEIWSATEIVRLSYSGKAWNVNRDTLAQLYPAGADVPDLDAEFRALEAPFPVAGPGGIWQFFGIDRRSGEYLDFERWRIEYIGDGKNQAWRIYEDAQYIGDIDLADYPLAQPKRPNFMQEIIDRPELAETRRNALFHGKPMIVPLASGSGFTKEEASSHLIIDSRGDVTVVDPNINVVEDMIRLGIPFERVKRILVSHVHFDHIAGIWRLIRNLPTRPELLIHSNPGDMEDIAAGRTGMGELSTLKALLKMAADASNGTAAASDLVKAFKVVPLKYGQTMEFGPMKMRFFFGNHTIPMTGYSILASDGRPAFTFTGDTRLSPADLFSGKRPGPDGKDIPVISPARAMQLSMLVAATLAAGGKVLGDAGVPTIHPTPEYYKLVISGLMAMGFEGKALEEALANLYSYHAAEKQVAASGLNYAKPGWEGAIELSKAIGLKGQRWQSDINVQMTTEAMLAVPVLTMLPASDFTNLPMASAVVDFKAGDALMRHGDAADSIYLILDGALEISRMEGGQKVVLQTRTHGLVGEAVLFDNATRNATVTAITDVKALKFLPVGIELLKKRNIAAHIRHLREMREQGELTTGQGGIRLYDGLNDSSRDLIFLHSKLEERADNEVLIAEGTKHDNLFTVVEGELTVSAAAGPLSQTPVTLGRGAIVGEGMLLGGVESSATVTAKGNARLMRLGGADAQGIMARQGGDFLYYLLGIAQDRGSIRTIPSMPPAPIMAGPMVPLVMPPPVIGR